MNVSVNDLLAILPALALVGGAFLVVAAATFGAGRLRPWLLELLCYLSLGVAILSVILRMMQKSEDPLAPLTGFGGAVRLDALALFSTLTIIIATGLAVVLSADAITTRETAAGEFYGLLLLAASGMVVLVEAAELITFFIALEVLSLALYGLSGMLRKDPRSNEAGIKYFVMGAFASGFVLYGMALLYGATGSVSIAKIGESISVQTAAPSALVPVGFVLLSIGLAFKVGAVPFHQWLPDAYEGAPTTVTAFMSVAVKAAGIAALLRILLIAGHRESDVWGAFLWAISLATMVAGNLLAIGQSNVKRMLAYSSIAHTGYLLGAVASLRGPGGPDAAQQEAGAAAIYYLFVYTFMTLGAFAFLVHAGRGDKDAEEIGDFAGLAKRNPWSALAMTLFMLSLGGIPPTGGFFGKYLIFKAMAASGETVLLITGVLSSAVSLYYYLRVVVYMYMKPEPDGAATPRMGFNSGLVIIACTLFILVLGLIPRQYLGLSYTSIQSLLR